MRQRGQSTLEWVIGAAVILGTLGITTGQFPELIGCNTAGLLAAFLNSRSD